LPLLCCDPARSSNLQETVKKARRGEELLLQHAFYSFYNRKVKRTRGKQDVSAARSSIIILECCAHL
jgi:hypothetical protein